MKKALLILSLLILNQSYLTPGGKYYTPKCSEGCKHSRSVIREKAKTNTLCYRTLDNDEVENTQDFNHLKGLVESVIECSQHNSKHCLVETYKDIANLSDSDSNDENFLGLLDDMQKAETDPAKIAVIVKATQFIEEPKETTNVEVAPVYLVYKTQAGE